MLRRTVISLILMFVSTGVYASTGSDSQKAIDELSRRIDILEYKIPLGFEEKLNTQSNNTLSEVTSITSLGMSQQQTLIGLFSLLFAIISIGIGVYVSSISKKVEDAEKRVRRAEESAKRTETKITSSLEQKSKELYRLIRNQETEDIFQRLQKYPEEILNSFPILATREIDPRYFDFLRKQVLEPKPNRQGANIVGQYKILLFQHFYSKMFKDEKLLSILKRELSGWIGSCFQGELDDMFEYVANQYIEYQLADYEWFLKQLRSHIQESILEKIKATFLEAGKEDLWNKIIEV